jgi:hypothetical protein
LFVAISGTTIAGRSLTQNTDRPLLAKRLYFFFVNI